MKRWDNDCLQCPEYTVMGTCCTEPEDKGQSKRWSLFEVSTNIVTGSLLGVLLNYYVLPLWGYAVSVGSAFSIGLVYSAISFVRSYLFRRLFNWLTYRREHNG